MAFSFRQSQISGKFIFHRLIPFFIITNVSYSYKWLIFASEIIEAKNYQSL